MPDNPEYGERTEPATPRKRDEARKKGQVSRSQEVNYALILLSSVIGLYFLSEHILDHTSRTIVHYFQDLLSFDLSRTGIVDFLVRASWETIKIFLPFSLLLVVVGFASNLLQVGFMMTGEPLVPKWDRINPLSGFGRIFSWRGLAELLKSILKIAAVSAASYFTLKKHLPRFFTLSHSSAGGILIVFGDVLFLLAIRCVLVLLIIALLDFAFQRWQYEKDLRMSVQEVKEEMKELYGDPMIRQRVRQIQRQMAQQRMMARIPEAEVVVTNPTHYAVALAYERMQMAAPTVVAKGKGYVALRIREIAQRHAVPIVEDPELARALYNSVEIGTTIPEVLYQAVARVLAYVYRLKANQRRAGYSPAQTGTQAFAQEGTV